MKRLLCLCLLASVASPFAQTAAIDWDREKAEILEHYRSLVRIDTSNPPGNETRAVDYLRTVLEGAGIPTRTFALEPQRANLVARIRGNGSKRPLLILAHTDVVPVQRDKWPVDPFGAVMQDGFVWGRGSRDDKDVVTANLIAMLLLKRSQVALDRDVIFLAESGEESSTQVGIDFMVARHFDEIDAEFAITEGGGGSVENGTVTRMSFATAEKVPRRARLVATGTSGHGSVPRQDNAIVHLAAAVAKVGAWETPMHLNETTRAYFEKLAPLSSREQAATYRALLQPSPPVTAQRYLAEHEPSHYSMLRTSVVPTMVNGGIGVNVIPSQAEAMLDIRALPEEDMGEFLHEMARVIDDPAVQIVPIANPRPVSQPSRLDTDAYRALETVSRRMFPGAATLPTMSTGASDKAQLRAKGIQSYGIGPASTAADTANYGAHSDVERLSEPALYDFVHFTWDVVLEIAAHK